jgi:hypothetical protein
VRAALLLLAACGGEIDPDAFAVRVVSFEPGDGAGYGQDSLPDVVLGPPRAVDGGGGSLDVLSLGREGTVVLELGEPAVDGPGVDLLVFENPFPGWLEPGAVAVSTDGDAWVEWPCDGEAGCAGITPALSNPDNGVDPTDPEVAGGDGFDLDDLGIDEARYVRIRDVGLAPSYEAPSGGFDLDAVAVVGAGAR